MIVHVYAICWNEEKMLPFFFKHYDSIADRFFIFDNGSTDGSLSMLRSHPKVHIDKFEVRGDSLILSAQELFNQFWKQSRGQADWVIVCDVDEHLYHPDLRAYLQNRQSQGVTLVVPTAFEMVSQLFPDTEKPLSETVRYGVRSPFYDKPQIFNPNEVEEINFIPGRHAASPVGRIVTSPDQSVLLLHYKYLGYDYVSSRYSTLKQGLRSEDVANGFGIQYLWDDRKKMDFYAHFMTHAVRVI